MGHSAGCVCARVSFVSSSVPALSVLTVYARIQWAPVAADYNCRLPADTSSTRIFILTFFGLFLPICFSEILGAALMTLRDPAYAAAFDDGETGGLLARVLQPWGGGGKFLLVVLALSVV